MKGSQRQSARILELAIADVEVIKPVMPFSFWMSSRPEEVTKVIERFARLAKTDKWLSESSYIADDVSHAFDKSELFKEISYRRSGLKLSFDAEWLGKGTLADLFEDFFSLYGVFAEDSQFVHHRIGLDVVSFQVLVGSTEPRGSHGHHLEIRLLGLNVRKLLRSQREFERREMKSLRTAREPKPRT